MMRALYGAPPPPYDFGEVLEKTRDEESTDIERLAEVVRRSGARVAAAKAALSAAQAELTAAEDDHRKATRALVLGAGGALTEVAGRTDAGADHGEDDCS